MCMFSTLTSMLSSQMKRLWSGRSWSGCRMMQVGPSSALNTTNTKPTLTVFTIRKHCQIMFFIVPFIVTSNQNVYEKIIHPKKLKLSSVIHPHPSKPLLIKLKWFIKTKMDYDLYCCATKTWKKHNKSHAYGSGASMQSLRIHITSLCDKQPNINRCSLSK